MKVAPITSPLPGEHLATTAPTMTPETPVDLRQRLNFWAGRALTAEALELEQEHRAAQLARLGRIGSAGIVTGLEVGLEAHFEGPPRPVGGPPTIGDYFVHVFPGHGLTILGEDVTVPRPLRVELQDLPIRAVAGDAVNGPVPWAAVLIARPAEIGLFANVDPNDPCELDPSRDAFADERRFDATALQLFQLPLAWKEDPRLGSQDDPRWRNRLANLIFNAEIEGARDRWETVQAQQSAFPWELSGLPLALVSFDLNVEIVGPGNGRLFVDRGSVTRIGGRARPRSRTASRSVPGDAPRPAGTPGLWRARVDQFAEHLGTLAELTPAQQATRFQFLPPVGLLSRSALDFLTTEEAIVLPPSSPGAPPDRAAASHFFPATFDVEAAPIPIEDLDVALASSAPLAPFDLTAPNDEVRVLVPVAQSVFDPRLLVVELEDPFFAAEVGRLIGVRQDWRQRRDSVRTMRDIWQVVISGPQPAGPATGLDRGQLEPEPVEGNEFLGSTAAYLSPADTAAPWEISAAFDSGDSDLAASELTPATVLFVRLRLDLENPPSRVEVRWRRGGEEFQHGWDEPSDAQLERLAADGSPLPLRLARLYTVTAGELGLTSGVLEGFTLHLEDGRVGVIDAGQLLPGEERESILRPWWTAEDRPEVTFAGGDWSRVTRSQMAAPFEQTYEPTFPDLSLVDRVAEIDTNLNLPEGERVLQVGLEKIVARVQHDLAKANDSVDLGFLKAQTNIHRIRQVMLGEEVANNLLTSPALSSVVKAQSAQIAQEDLVSAFKATTAAPVTTVPPAAAPAGNNLAISSVGNVAVVSGFTASSTLFKTTGPAFATTQPQAIAGNLVFKELTVEKAPGLATVSNVKAVSNLGTQFTVPTRSDVVNAEPVVGKSFDLRTLTIAKRFDVGPTRTAFDFADAGLIEVLSRVTAVDLGYEDTDMIPDVTDDKEKAVSFARLFREGTPLLQKLRTSHFDEADVSALFSNGIRRADAMVLILRRFEFYIARRQEQLGRAREVLETARASVAAANGRLGVIEGSLAEARHDVSVARALRQEERERVSEINTRRDALIRDEVKFLAYVRPRAVDPVRRRLPGWKLENSDALAPVPACLRLHDQPPEALRAYVQLFQQAPVRWFPEIANRLAQLDTVNHLIGLLAATQRSASIFAVERRIAFAQDVPHLATRNTLLSAFARVEPGRIRASALQLAWPAGVSWSDLHQQAQDHSSLGDIISGQHGNPALAQAAAAMLDQIESVATCLHAEFAAVSAATRLIWVERYSQFDQPLPLRDLTALPRYATLDRAARRRFQAFVDWLFQRVDNNASDAFSLVNDLIRICLLLASHAPVKSLIAGHLPRPVPVRPGILIPLQAFDPKLVKIGMEVHVWRANTLVAQARVEDLGESGVSARVVRVEATTATLDSTMKVQFVPAALGISHVLALPTMK